jgi:hypothetical protein
MGGLLAPPELPAGSAPGREVEVEGAAVSGPARVAEKLKKPLAEYT